jgi:predicted Rossmann fold flavoprotein
VYCNDGRFRDALLFTHRGLSGPAILQISSYWNGGDALSIDLLPGSDAHAWLETERRSTARLDNILARRLPRRFAQQWSGAHHAAVPVSALDEKRRHELASLLHAWPVLPSGTLGYNKAEVTLGGVDTRALSSRTMAARELPRLHFIGEVVDVTGWLGGYNFQWAWASAAACARAIAAVCPGSRRGL